MNYYKLQNGNIAETGFCDYFTDSPRDWDNLGTFLTWLNGYSSPDKNDYASFEEFINDFDVYPKNWDWNEEDVIEELIENADKKGYFLFPVYVYEHSQITYSIKPTIPYGGIGGVIYVEKEEIFSETSLTPKTENLLEKVKELLGGEVTVYNLWANGCEMQYSEYDLKEEYFVDSCSGFYGLDEKESGIYDMFELENAEYIGEFNNIDGCLNSLVSQGLIKRTTNWA